MCSQGHLLKNEEVNKIEKDFRDVLIRFISQYDNVESIVLPSPERSDDS